MPKFTYVSKNREGQRVTAVMEAENRQTVLTQLKDRGHTILELKEMGGQAAKKKKKSLKDLLQIEITSSRIGTSDLAIFWREFATMVASGLAIVDALQSISEEMEHPAFKKILQTVVSNIWEGFSLSESLKRHPKVFSPMVVALMGAAEESGSLPEVANQLANFLENRDRLIRKVRAALTYPIFLSAFFLVVLCVASFWIIPKFKDIYSSFDAKLPWLTETVFGINDLILNHFVWIALVAAALITAFIYWARQPRGQEIISGFVLKIPVFGKLMQRAAIARFSRSLAILLGGGIPINRALEMAQETSGNPLVAKAVGLAREEIMKGTKITASLKRHSIFPAMAIRMISAGEETGNLASLLEKIADFYESRVDAALTTVNALIEPIFIVVIGLFVLIFILALYMPIFSLGMSMKG